MISKVFWDEIADPSISTHAKSSCYTFDPSGVPDELRCAGVMVPEAGTVADPMTPSWMISTTPPVAGALVEPKSICVPAEPRL